MSEDVEVVFSVWFVVSFMNETHSVSDFVKDRFLHPVAILGQAEILRASYHADKWPIAIGVIAMNTTLLSTELSPGVNSPSIRAGLVRSKICLVDYVNNNLLDLLNTLSGTELQKNLYLGRNLG